VSGADLERELADAVAALSDAQHEDLVLAGVNRIDIGIGMIGAAYGSVVDIHRFEPCADGGLAFVTPIRVHHASTIESTIPDSACRVGDIVDLVYWSINSPDCWALRTGNAEVLGLIPPQFCKPEPVAIHRGPLGWFRHGCAGLVVLSPDPWAVYRLLSQCSSGLLAEDERHAEELRAALEHPWPRPPVLVRKRRHAAL
jgi:hypothetical protein